MSEPNDEVTEFGLVSRALGGLPIVNVVLDRLPTSNTGKCADTSARCAERQLGHPPQAPYDRVIATVGSKYVPYAWVEQTRPGGRIVAPSWALNYYGLLLALTVSEDGTAAGHFVDDASFMMLRDQRVHRSRQIISDHNEYEQATVTETDIHPAEVASGSYSRGVVIAIGTRFLTADRTTFRRETQAAMTALCGWSITAPDPGHDCAMTTAAARRTRCASLALGGCGTRWKPPTSGGWIKAVPPLTAGSSP